MIDVQLRHLRTLSAVAETGTFARAGAHLGYTQSSVSQQIAALERAVGGAVFDRPGGPKAVRLTPLGQLVLDHASKLLAGADQLDEAVARYHAGDGRVDIGTFQSVSSVVLPALAQRLRAERPTCEIRLFEGEPENPRIGSLDLLFHDGPIRGDVKSVKLIDDPYVLVARPGRFPAGPVPWRLLDGLAMVAWPAACDQPRLEQALADHDTRPHVVFRSASNETLLAAVRSDLGFALLPQLVVAGLSTASDDELEVHDLDPAPSREIYLHWPSDRTLSPLAQRAIDIARELRAVLSAAAKA